MTIRKAGRTAPKTAQGAAGNGGKGKEDPEKECVKQALRVCGVLGIDPGDLGIIRATDGAWHISYKAKLIASEMFATVPNPNLLNGRPS
jgi:hypothetical protein